MDEIRIKLTCLDKIVFAIVAVLAAIVLILILFGCSTPSFERGIDAGADAGDAGDAGDDGSVDSDADAGPDAATDTDSDTPPFDAGVDAGADGSGDTDGDTDSDTDVEPDAGPLMCWEAGHECKDPLACEPYGWEIQPNPGCGTLSVCCDFFPADDELGCPSYTESWDYQECLGVPDVCEDINMPEFGCCYHGTLYRCPDYGWPDYDDTLLIEDCNAEAEETGHDIHCCAMSSMGGMGCALISM